MTSYSQLDRPVQFLKGVGPKRADALARMGIGTARDLLYHIPRRYDDASTLTPIGSLAVGLDATAVGRVRSKGVMLPGPQPRSTTVSGASSAMRASRSIAGCMRGPAKARY